MYLCLIINNIVLVYFVTVTIVVKIDSVVVVCDGVAGQSVIVAIVIKIDARIVIRHSIVYQGIAA